MRTINISESGYKRPAKTYREMLSKKDMAKLLDDYIEEDIDKIPVQSHVRYVTIKNGKQQFFTGRTLVLKSNDYVILTNKTKFMKKQPVSWSVQKRTENDKGEVFDTVFFTKVTKAELKYKEEINALENSIQEQNELIEEQQKEILKLRKYIKKMKSVN